MAQKEKLYNHRYVSHIVMEAATPLAVGSGEKNIETDALVARDVNGLPYIPGTAIAGIMRHSLGYASNQECVFGYANGDFGYGSKIILTEARMVGEDGRAVDGLRNGLTGPFFSGFETLPIRQHVRIGHRGVTEDAGKFDEEIVFKGTRFCFEMELMSDDNSYSQDFKEMDTLLRTLCSGHLRFGGGTRCGFGEMKVISCKTRKLDFGESKEDLSFYINKTSSLSEEWERDNFNSTDEQENEIKYELSLVPEDFFLFGSGFGDDEADMTPVKERIIVWKDGKPDFKDDCVLLPATSLKGALSHRTAYYYNKLNSRYSDKEPKETIENLVGKNNAAVVALFGSEGEEGDGMRLGNVIFSDIIEEKDIADKILNHVSIDQFTGGAISGALFSERVTYLKSNDKTLSTAISVDRKAFKTGLVQDAFEEALKDICRGMLPLGGGVNRGNGTFSGILTRDGEVIYSKEEKK